MTAFVETAAEPTELDALVVRMCREFPVTPEDVRREAVPILASFHGARIRAFIPLLLEKELRGRLRNLSGLCPTET